MDILIALGWGLVAGSALLIGAALGWFVTLPKRLTASVMAFGSGVLISAVAFDLMDEAREMGGLLSAALGFLAGAAAFTLGAVILNVLGARHRKRSGPSPGPDASAAGVIALGSVFDGIPESAVIGLSLLDGQGVAVPVVIAVFLSNVPEGLSSSAGMKSAGLSRTYVFSLWSGIALVCGLGAVAGYVLFDGAPPEYVAVAQGVAAGAILAMIADTMIPEAFDETHNAAGLVVALGFLLAFVLSHAFG